MMDWSKVAATLESHARAASDPLGEGLLDEGQRATLVELARRIRRVSAPRCWRTRSAWARPASPSR